jgi:polyhydroxybutyrate depolymerase
MPEDLPTGAPLLVVLHGFTSSARNIMQYSGFNELAEAHGFAVVYPQGTKDEQDRAFWNVGYDFHKDIKVDDVGFISNLVGELQHAYGLSLVNTFVTGMSNGGEMCYYLACRQPGVFKAIAPVAGTMMKHFFTNCAPEAAVPVLSIFGTHDKTTNYHGDMTNQDGWGAYAGVPTINSFWSNALEMQSVVTDTLPDLSMEDGSHVVRTTYRDSLDSSRMVYLEIVGGGHDWPGAWGNMDIQASREIWAFFEKIVK